MNVLTRIQAAVRDGRYEVTSHALEETQADGFTPLDVVEAVLRGRVVKRYTYDPRGARYKLLGPSEDGRQVFVVCRFLGSGEVRIITVYGSADETKST